MAKRDQRQRIGDSVTSFIAMGRMYRMMELIHLLIKKRWTIEQLAKQLDICTRTVYRHIDMIEALGYCVDKDFSNKYFIAAETCPLCGAIQSNQEDVQDEEEHITVS
jgi:transcriptional antiterminator